MINVIVCDDNYKDRKQIISIVRKNLQKVNDEYRIYEFNDYNLEFNKIIDENLQYKIYLLDIETPSRSGIDIAREIRKKDVDSVIIFLTVHEELGNVVLRDELMFLSFINKFDNFENRLNSSLKKSIKLLGHKQIIKISDKNILYTIDINDILYVTKECFERKTIIRTDYNIFKISKPLSEIVKLLDYRFIQTHRACFINSDRKVKIDKRKREITFDNGETIDLLSEKYKKVI